MSKIMKPIPKSLLYFLTALLIPLLTACPGSDGDANNDGRVQIALSQVHEEHHHDEEDHHGDDDHHHDCEEEEGDGPHSEEEEEGGEPHTAEEEGSEPHTDEEEGGEPHECEEEGTEEPEASSEEEGEEYELEDSAGHGVELHAAYVVLDQFQLVECSSIATVIQRSLQGLIGQAFANDGHDHGHGHGSSDRPEVPENQRNLNRPHVISLTSEDEDEHDHDEEEEHDDHGDEEHDHSESPLVLGNARIAEGRYCGLRVSIVPAADDAFGLPEDLSMIGTGFYFDFEQDIDGDISERVIDSSGLPIPHTMTLEFDEPLVINANTHHVVVGLHMAHLFEEIDLSTDSDAQVRSALLGGLDHAMEIIDQGEGELE